MPGMQKKQVFSSLPQACAQQRGALNTSQPLPISFFAHFENSYLF
jgi:hypothetical protein